MATQRVYLDYNATTPVKPAVARAVAAALAEPGNPSSVHAEGRRARRMVEDARQALAAAIGTEPRRIVFTSGGTEANALALKGCGRRRVIVSAVEHASVLGAVPGCAVVPCDRHGVVRLEALDAALAGGGEDAVLSVMLANNETGVIQPVAEAVEIARARGALVHVDAAQAPGRVPLSVAELGADFVTVSAHKMGGPPGIGALVVAGSADVTPQALGGGQELGRRAGTEAVALIAGFGVAASLIADDLADAARIAGLRDRFEAAIARDAPDAVVHGQEVARLPNTSSIGMAGVAAATQVMALDLAGFAVSAGSACSSGKVGRSHVLAAMGLGEAEAGCAIRVSLGWRSIVSEVDEFVAAWRALHVRLGRTRAAA
ncbi:MAG: cysteine desulfurase family protein [Alphaproteobacteria bacterium]